MNENFDPIKEWEQKMQDREARYNRILLMLKNGEENLAKEKNYEHLFAIIEKQKIKEGDMVTVISHNKREDDEFRDDYSEDGKFVEINNNEVLLSGVESDFDFSIPIETVSDIYHVNRPGY